MRRMFLPIFLVFLVCVSLCQAEPAVRFKPGDVWVLVGDSITAQRLHTEYFEAFCQSRFPEYQLRFRNSGVGGDTVGRALARFDWDAAIWKPTVVSVELGMNDARGGDKSVGGYIAGMKKLVSQIESIGARPVLFSASPVNDGGLPGRLPPSWNATLERYATELGKVAAAGKIPWGDQFHALHSRWTHNTRLVLLPGYLADWLETEDVPGREHLQAWIASVKPLAGRRYASLERDSVHPGPPGQLTMAGALIRALGLGGQVSSVAIDAAGKRVSRAERCKVTRLMVEGDKVTFDRHDSVLPMPIPAKGRPGLIVMPEIASLSEYVLTVTGLKSGQYDIYIDGELVVGVSADALAGGWEMGILDKGPIARQTYRLLELIREKGDLVGQARSVAKDLHVKKEDSALRKRYAGLLRKVRGADETIHACAETAVHRFVVCPHR